MARIFAVMVGMCMLAAPLTTAQAERTEVPVEMSVGPSAFAFANPGFGGAGPGPIAREQAWHPGLRFEVAAVIDKQWADDHPDVVPKKYRDRLSQLGEVRYRPTVLAVIPRSIVVSPNIAGVGTYGATWSLIGADVGISIEDVRLTAGAHLLASYFFIHSAADAPAFDQPTHFLRPGVDVGLGLHVPLAENWGFSVGWNSHAYIPQRVGGGVFEVGSAGKHLWHVGEGFLVLRHTFPLTIDL